MKPNLATDYDPETLWFPVLYLPKIDGVRGLHLTGGLTGRSLKKFKNKYTTERSLRSAMQGWMVSLPVAPELLSRCVETRQVR